MIRLLPRLTRTDQLFPYPTLCRSGAEVAGRVDRVTGRPTQRCADRDHEQGDGDRRQRAEGTGHADFDVAVVGEGEDDEHEHERADDRSEEHTSELQSLMRISYAVFCLKKKTTMKTH